MARPVIITCAVTGGGDTVGKHPAIPVTPEQIAQSAIEAGRAGAAFAHLHVRDSASGKPIATPQQAREILGFSPNAADQAGNYQGRPTR